MSTGLAERLMQSTGTIGREQSTPDSRGGGFITSYAIIAVDVPCKLDMMSQIDEIVGDQKRRNMVDRLYVPLGTDIKKLDRFTMDDGRVLEVLSAEPPGGKSISGGGGQLRCSVKEIQHGVTSDG